MILQLYLFYFTIVVSPKKLKLLVEPYWNPILKHNIEIHIDYDISLDISTILGPRYGIQYQYLNPWSMVAPWFSNLTKASEFPSMFVQFLFVFLLISGTSLNLFVWVETLFPYPWICNSIWFLYMLLILPQLTTVAKAVWRYSFTLKDWLICYTRQLICYLFHWVILHLFDMQFSTYFVDAPVKRRFSNQFCIYNQGIWTME